MALRDDKAGGVVLSNRNAADVKDFSLSDKNNRTQTDGYYEKVEAYDESDRKLSHMGYFGWRPKFLEVFNKPAYFVVIFGISNFFMVMSFAILSLIIPTLEKVFNLNSKETGFIVLANDLTGTVAGILLANYCSSRKIRCIAIGMWLVGIAGIISSSPTIFAEYPQSSGQISNMPKKLSGPFLPGPSMCKANDTTALIMDKVVNAANDYAARNHKYYWLLVLGALIQGIGTTPPGIAGSTYMDEIFTEKQFGVAISILYVASFLGYPLSMITGSEFLSFYVTLKPPKGMTPASKEWIGAWWLGIFIPTLVVFVLGFLLLLFPVQMPAAKKVLAEKITRKITSAQEKKAELHRSLMEITRDTIPGIKRMLANKAYDCLVIGDCFMFLQIGSLTFYPKIYSMIYRLHPKSVGTIVGTANLLGFSTGLLVGGLLLKFNNWKVKQLQLVYSIMAALCIPFTLAMLYYCPTLTYAGIDVGYPNSLQASGLSDICNSNCSCTTAFYQPVCDNGITYFSPCHAGCSVMQGKHPPMMHYSGCTCTDTGSARAGVCGEQCMDRLWISLVLVSIGTVINFAGYAPHAIIYQRIVSEVDRTLAQGVRQFATRALGTLPAPILFGWILDNFCTVWKTNEDGSKGNCWIYDVDGFMMYFMVVTVLIKVLSAAFYFLCWWLYPDTPMVVISELNGNGETIENFEAISDKNEHEMKNIDI